MMGVYAQNFGAFANAGLPVFPVDTKAKRPAVRGWQDATARRARGWASKPKLAAADGLGIVMGAPSGLVEVDVDAVGDAWVQAAVERFGDTPIIIRTASGKAKLWFRHNGEGRSIRPFPGLPVDILGGGFTIAPPSWRDDLGASYTFVRGGVADLRNLPVMRPAECLKRVPEAVRQGDRNTALFRHCMTQARHCDDVEALLDVAMTWASCLPEPLSAAEVEQCARSAWRYETRGRNFLGLRKPQLCEADVTMDALLDAPEALVLLQMFQRWHAHRSTFAIAPRAMSERGSPPWPRGKIEAARDVLIERGFIEEVSAPSKEQRKAGIYRLRPGLPGYGHNHYTPSPLLSPSPEYRQHG